MAFKLIVKQYLYISNRIQKNRSAFKDTEYHIYISALLVTWKKLIIILHYHTESSNVDGSSLFLTFSSLSLACMLRNFAYQMIQIFQMVILLIEIPILMLDIENLRI